MQTDTEHVLTVLEERRDRNRSVERIDNGSLYAGSPMYYYCRTCGEEMRLPESHLEAAPTFCISCDRLVDSGIIDGQLVWDPRAVV